MVLDYFWVLQRCPIRTLLMKILKKRRQTVGSLQKEWGLWKRMLQIMIRSNIWFFCSLLNTVKIKFSYCWVMYAVSGCSFRQTSHNWCYWGPFFHQKVKGIAEAIHSKTTWVTSCDQNPIIWLLFIGHLWSPTRDYKFKCLILERLKINTHMWTTVFGYYLLLILLW